MPPSLELATGRETNGIETWCFGLYFVNYRSWQAEILQKCAEGCIQVDLQKHFYFVVL